MSQIRNSCVAFGSIVAGGGGVIYTVPADRVLLLKSMYFAHTGAVHAELLPVSPEPLPAPRAAYNLYVALELSPGVNLAIINAVGLTVMEQKWEGWLAMNAGQRIILTTQNGTQLYWVSGALLPTIP